MIPMLTFGSRVSLVIWRKQAKKTAPGTSDAASPTRAHSRPAIQVHQPQTPVPPHSSARARSDARALRSPASGVQRTRTSNICRTDANVADGDDNFFTSASLSHNASSFLMCAATACTRGSTSISASTRRRTARVNRAHQQSRAARAAQRVHAGAPPLRPPPHRESARSRLRCARIVDHQPTLHRPVPTQRRAGASAASLCPSRCAAERRTWCRLGRPSCVCARTEVSAPPWT